MTAELGGASPAQSEAANPNPVTAIMTGLVKTGQFSPWFLPGAFLLSLALGGLHALTPGHGKALVGAFLVGSAAERRMRSCWVQLLQSPTRAPSWDSVW